VARADRKAVERRERLLDHFHLHHPGERRSFRRNTPDKGLDRCRLPRRFDFDPVGLIPHPTGEPVAISQLEDEGAKSHALDDTSNPDRHPPLGGAAAWIRVRVQGRRLAERGLRAAHCGSIRILGRV